MAELWTEERDEKLIKLLAHGMSSSRIARELGVTRNAVIGRKHRIGAKSPTDSMRGEERKLLVEKIISLSSDHTMHQIVAKLSVSYNTVVYALQKNGYKPIDGRTNARQEPGRFRRRLGMAVDEKRSSKDRSPGRRDLREEHSMHEVGLMELENYMCRWPTRMDEHQFFCGARRVEGNAYCMNHCQRAYRATP